MKKVLSIMIKVLLIIAGVAIVSLVALYFIGINVKDDTAGKIDVGTSVEVAKTSIRTSGGTITVGESGGLLSGFRRPPVSYGLIKSKLLDNTCPWM